jgi:hypothetical protein
LRTGYILYLYLPIYGVRHSQPDISSFYDLSYITGLSTHEQHEETQNVNHEWENGRPLEIALWWAQKYVEINVAAKAWLLSFTSAGSEHLEQI